jgi:hypothetical protein
MVFKRTLQRNGWFILLLLVLSANYTLYHTPLGMDLLPVNPNLVVVGSMIDLAVISPVLFLAWKRKLNPKNVMLGVAAGLVFVRFLIPIEFLAPFQAVTWVGFAVEGGALLLEILVLVTLFNYLPRIIRTASESPLPLLFSFSKAVNQHVKAQPIIRIICSEMLMYYYAFASWRKKPRLGPGRFTLHQKSSLLSLNIMLIHATIIEMAGLHWWLHEKSLVLSLVLLVVNLYTIVLLIGNLQAVRHNPLLVTEKGFYLSLGLMKRIEIKWSDIEEVTTVPKQDQYKSSKNTLEFIARDFELATPDFVFKLKQPVAATLLMGVSREYSLVALKVDDPVGFRDALMCRVPGTFRD